LEPKDHTESKSYINSLAENRRRAISIKLTNLPPPPPSPEKDEIPPTLQDKSHTQEKLVIPPPLEKSTSSEKVSDKVVDKPTKEKKEKKSKDSRFRVQSVSLPLRGTSTGKLTKEKSRTLSISGDPQDDLRKRVIGTKLKILIYLLSCRYFGN
jgi:hypothetical protein